MNKVILIGNLANNPEAAVTQSGISRSTFRLAVQRKYANQQGVREADFFTIIAWRTTADFCNRYLLKGRKVAVEGSIQNRTYTAQDGSPRYVTEIVADSVEAVGGKREDGADDNGPEPPPAAMGHEGDGSGQFEEVEDDELPF